VNSISGKPAKVHSHTKTGTQKPVDKVHIQWDRQTRRLRHITLIGNRRLALHSLFTLRITSRACSKTGTQRPVELETKEQGASLIGNRRVVPHCSSFCFKQKKLPARHHKMKRTAKQRPELERKKKTKGGMHSACNLAM